MFDSEEARGEMKIQDRLVQVDNDRFVVSHFSLLISFLIVDIIYRIEGWPLNRVIQRLGDFR